MREIYIDLSSDNHLQQLKMFGGHEGEHNETVLKVKLPKRMTNIECSGYRFDFQTSEGNEINSPLIPVSELNDDTLSFKLIQQLTIAGELIFKVAAVVLKETTVDSIAKTNRVVLYIMDSPKGNVQLIDPNGYKDELQKMIDECVEVAVEVASIGRKTANMGEIFNDYENNKALSPYSHSEGTTSIAGGKGFVIIAKSGTKGDVGTYTLEGYTGGYEVGDIWSACISSNYDFNGTITAIESNVITVDNYAEGAEDTDPWVFWVHTKPNVGNISLEYGQHAEGDNTVAIQRSAHAEGRNSIASGKYSHTEGRETLAGYASHAEGRGTKALGEQSHTEGYGTIAYNNAHAEGSYRVAKGGASHAEGQGIKNNETIGALGVASHVEGKITTASATGAHAEGSYTNAQGVNSHAEGTGVKDSATGCPDLSYGALGEASHSEGSKTTASALGAHSEGVNTVAGHSAAHAEGYATTASNRYTHAEGFYTKATAQCSHAQGYYTEAKNSYSDVAGAHTKSSAMCQSVVGRANKDNPDALFIVGNGEFDGDEKISESNAFEVFKDGHAEVQAQGETAKSAVQKQYVDTLFEKVIDKQYVDTLFEKVKLAAHPVGSYYWSSDATSPEDLFGGEWEAVKDKFILAAGDSYTAGQTGGEAEHILTVDEMPGHSHNVVSSSDSLRLVLNQIGTGVGSYAYADRLGNGYYNAWITDVRGGDQAHNNMPPYEVAYCWKRIN